MRVNSKLRNILFGVLILSLSVGLALQGQSASATQITARSLTLQTGDGGDGGSKASGTVKHKFMFTVPNVGAGNVLSIKFEYCTTAAGTCTLPTGLTTNGGTTALTDEQGAAGFTLNKTTNGAPYLTRASGTIPAGTQLTYQISDIVNPSNLATFFVRISTYSVADPNTGSPTPVDTGTVAATTVRQIVLTGTMPESLIFCAAATITTTNGIPDCTTALESAVSFNQLFSPTDTATATSQMAASTNATNGYSISVNGPTLTSGSNTITAMSAQTTGIRGTSQFGMNLKLNTVATSTVPVGAEVAAASNGTDLRGQAATGYQTVDNFKFVTGEVVAKSDYMTAGPTNAQIFTVSYIVNVSGSQTAGSYTSTLTYICTAAF